MVRELRLRYGDTGLSGGSMDCTDCRNGCVGFCTNVTDTGCKLGMLLSLIIKLNHHLLFLALNQVNSFLQIFPLFKKRLHFGKNVICYGFY